MSELNKEELSGMENIIRKVINCDQFTNSIDNPTEKREKNIKWAVEQIVALIQKPEVTEEWIEEKAKELLKWQGANAFAKLGACKNFIRKIVEEI